MSTYGSMQRSAGRSRNQILSPESHPQNDVNAEKQSADSCCIRCEELNLPILLSSHPHPTNPTIYSAAVVQRLLFDDVPSCDGCSTCDSLARNHNLTFFADKVYHAWPSQKVKDVAAANSWFTRTGSQLIRKTGKSDYDGFSSGTFDRVGRGFWERETFTQTTHLVGPTPDFSRINQWLGTCTHSHTACREAYSDALKIISLYDVKLRKLVKYSTNTPDYIALSYVWGRTPAENASLNRLPQVIQDSITVVEALGKRFLWVDSICIDQDNPQDKMKQIEIMDAIYEGAFATIIALDSTNADQGLPGMNSHNQRKPQLIAEFGANRLVGELPTLKAQVKQGSWNKRAWTFQEGILSNRRLIFSQHQVYFVCNEMQCNESLEKADTKDSPAGVTKLALPRTSESLKRRKSLLIHSTINSYIKRSVTYDEDALNAVTALLKRLAPIACPDGFLHGLPLWSFRNAIRWRQASASLYIPTAQLRLNETKRRKATCIPTWSWASWVLPYRIVMADDHVSAQAPPLSIMHNSRELVREEIPMTTRTNQSIQPSYQNLPLDDRTSTQDKPNHYLLVTGILLRFPCYIGTSFGGRWAADAPSPAPNIAFPNDLLAIEYLWYNDGHVEDIVPGSGGVVDNSKRVEHDFLMVNASTYKHTTTLILLHLYWRDDLDQARSNDVATRGGILTVDVKDANLESFWYWSRPQSCRFWLR